MTWTTTTFGTLINLDRYSRLAVKRDDTGGHDAALMAYDGPDGDQRVVFRGTWSECEEVLAHVARLMGAYDLSHVPATNGNGREMAGVGV